MNEKLVNLYNETVTDLEKLEKAEEEGLAAIAAFGGSSENLLRAILKVKKTWVFPEDRKPYEEVKESILDYAKTLGREVNLSGSIAGGKFRAEARKSDDLFIRLAGRLAGRLSTLISNAKTAAEKANKGKTETKTKTDKGDKIGKAWEEGFQAGMAQMGVIVLAAIKAKKTLKEIAEAITANTTAEDRKIAADRIKETLKKAA